MDVCYLPLYSWFLAQCLAYGRCSINVCKMNEIDKRKILTADNNAYLLIKPNCFNLAVPPLLSGNDFQTAEEGCSQSYGFSSSHVWMWDLDHIGGWAQKNWCFRSIMLEKTLESPLDCKRIKSVNPKGYQPWIFTGWTDAKTEAAMLWPPDVKEPTHWERPWCWGRLKAKREGGQRIRWLNSIMNSMDKNLSKL